MAISGPQNKIIHNIYIYYMYILLMLGNLGAHTKGPYLESLI